MKIINKAKSWVFKEGLNPGMRVKIRLSKRKIDKTPNYNIRNKEGHQYSAP